jgi:hypothetical protein
LGVISDSSCATAARAATVEASLIGLRKMAAVKPRQNFKLIWSLAASFFRQKLENKVVKTSKYSSAL